MQLIGHNNVRMCVQQCTNQRSAAPAVPNKATETPQTVKRLTIRVAEVETAELPKQPIATVRLLSLKAVLKPVTKIDVAFVTHPRRFRRGDIALTTCAGVTSVGDS
jgi:hypothetical protein